MMGAIRRESAAMRKGSPDGLTRLVVGQNWSPAPVVALAPALVSRPVMTDVVARPVVTVLGMHSG